MKLINKKYFMKDFIFNQVGISGDYHFALPKVVFIYHQGTKRIGLEIS